MPLGAFKTALMGAAGAGGAFEAYGGHITQYVKDSVTYRVHTFRGDGKFEVTSGTVDATVLLIAGGGGGTAEYYGGGGGGGAGGMRTVTGVTLTAQEYAITVGTGGQRGGYDIAGTQTGWGADKGGDTLAFGYDMDGGGAGGPRRGTVSCHCDRYGFHSFLHLFRLIA